MFCSIQHRLSSDKMGCICSKDLGRSISIKEELNHGFHSTSLAWEELLASNGSNDQLFALICSANSQKSKLRSSSLTLPLNDQPDIAPEADFTASTWDMLSPDINLETDIESTPDVVVQATESSRFSRSKSWQMPRSENEDEIEWKDKNQTGSRSFHTVEEYDALLERIHKSSTRSGEPFEDHHFLQDTRSRKSKSLDEDQIDSCIEAVTDHSLNPKSSGPMQKLDKFEDAVQDYGTRKTGWKRKVVANRLTSLAVPAVEFPAIARIRQGIHVEGQVYSPGTYITPKFGSYNTNTKATLPLQENESGGNLVFSPELVAVFEDCMQQMLAEENSILIHMDEYSPVEEATRDQVEKSPTKHQ